MCSTCAAVSAAIQRISFGTSVPGPRTSRSSSPRLTASTSTLERSIEGMARTERGKSGDGDGEDDGDDPRRSGTGGGVCVV